jgi:hypothetical protein
MSITAQYVRVTEQELQQMLGGDIKKVDALLEEQSGRGALVGAKPSELDALCKKYTGFWRHMEFMEDRMKKAGVSETQLRDEMKKRGLHLWFDLDKLWQEMHLLLTGEDFPLQLPKVTDPLSLSLVAEDIIQGTEHYGYGAARYNSPATVKKIAKVLSQQKYGKLVEKYGFDAETQLGIEDEDMEKDLNDFASFYSDAAKNNEAIVLVFM